jgi:protein ImuA
LFYIRSQLFTDTVFMNADTLQTRRVSGEMAILRSERKEQLATLRAAVARIEHRQHDTKSSVVPIGIETVDDHLPNAGLAVGVCHEVYAAAYGDRPSAFGFAFAVMATAMTLRPGPAVMVMARGAIREFGRPYVHGLHQHGIDTERLIVVETRSDKDAHWALEEILRSDARPSIVVAALGGEMTLTVSRRLNLAAAAQLTPLTLLRLSAGSGSSAAGTRWLIGAAPAKPAPFKTFGRSRWHTRLERCRNGHPGDWLIEWTHGSHCFRLAEGMADRAAVANESCSHAI